MSGPSGAGKSTVVAGLAARLPFSFSVSMTTRDRRPGEVDGESYFFVDPTEFRASVDRGDLIEWAEYGGNLYGTPAAAVAAARAAGDDVLLDIEIKGSRVVKERFPDAIMIWIDAPDATELERRLRGRGDTSEADVMRRLRLAQEHSQQAREVFDHFVVNQNLEVAIDQVADILATVPESVKDS